MKKVISLLLAVCLLLGLVPMASAADSMTTMERALVETALTFYYKGNSVQYDSYYLSGGARYTSGILRQSNNREPEEATPDDIHFSVCSAFPHDAYFSAFGEHIISRQRQEKVAYLTHEFVPYMKGMNLTDEQLAYELALDGVTATYTAVGEHYDDTKENIDNMVIGYWGPVKGADGKDTDEFTNMQTSSAEVQAMMRPGDIIAAHPKVVDEDGGIDESGGHTMMFLGDIFGDGKDYVIHSSGTKYNNNDGADNLLGPTGEVLVGHDRLEATANWANYSTTGTSRRSYNRNGTIIVTPFADLLGKGKSYDVTRCYDFTILRPLNAFTEADLTPSAKFRLHHPALGIYKTANVKPYRDVLVGDTVTYTVRIDNNTRDTVNMYDIGEGVRISDTVGLVKGWGAVVKETSRNKTYSDLVLTETLPAGTEFVSSTVTPTQKGSTLTWKVPTVKPGESVSISYTVKVTGGTQVVSPKGIITATGEGRLITKELTHQVVSQQAPADKFASVTASTVTASAAALRTGTDVAGDLYGALGYDLTLPHAAELVELLCHRVKMPVDKGYTAIDFLLAEAQKLTDPAAKTLQKMIVPGMVGGKRLHTMDENGVRTNENRLRVLRQDFLQPGDILVYANGGRSETDSRVASPEIVSENAYVYLGNDNFAYYEDGKLVVKHDPIVTYWSKAGTNGQVLPEELGSNVQPTADKYGSKKYSYSEIFHKAFIQDLFVVLRPARVGLKTAAATTNAKAVELKSGSNTAWFADFSTAYTAAADGDTLVLHEDLSLAKRQSFQKSLTVDLNGHTITSTSAEPKDLLNLLDGEDAAQKTYVFKNGTVDGPIYAGNTAKVRFENMTLKGRNWEYTAGSITRKGAAVCKSTNASVTFSATNIMSTGASYVPLQNHNAVMPYVNVTFEDDVVVMLPENVAWDYSTITMGENVQVYTGTERRSLDGMQHYSAYGVGYIPVTFTSKPAVYNETKDVYYASFSEAGKVISNGDSLKLLRDVDTRSYNEVAISCGEYDGLPQRTKYLVSSYDMSWTLDLDGHTIHDPMMGAGTLILRGKVASGYQVTLKNGTMSADNYCINNGTHLVLENMVLLSGDNTVYMSNTGDKNQIVDAKNCQFVGGFFCTAERAAVNVLYGTLNLSDCKLLSPGGSAITMANETPSAVHLEKATLGTFLYSYNYYGAIHLNSGTCSIAQGCGQTAARTVEYAEVCGKLFPFVCDTYAVTEPAAAIGQENFLTLEAALAAAKEGDTVTLCKDAAVADTFVPQGVTLDVKEHKLTLDADAVLTVAGKVVAENGEVDVSDGRVKLEGKGDYLGVTAPEGVEGDVYADANMNAEINFAVGSSLVVTGALPQDYSHCKVTVNGRELTAQNGKFALGTISAKELNKTFTLLLSAETEDGITVGKAQTVSLRSLAEGLLENLDWNTAAPAGKALVALLNYGAAAQTYFGQDISNPANGNIGKYQQHLDFDLASARKDLSHVSGVHKAMVLGASCVLGQDLGFKLYFDFGAGEDITVDIAWGDTKLEGLTPADLTAAADGVCFYEPQGFSLKDFETEFAITVYQNGKEVAQATDSAASYVARLYATGETALADAILTYALAVKVLS